MNTKNKHKLKKVTTIFLSLAILAGMALTPTQATNAATCTDQSSTFCAGATVTGAPLSAQTSGAITIKIGNQGTTRSNAIVDIEIYDGANRKVFQKYFEGQTLLSNWTRAYLMQWTPPAAGYYTVKVGLFTDHWSQNIYWNDNAGKLTVAASVPTPLTTPTPATLPAPATPTPAPSESSLPTASSIQIWWPTANAALSGVQPFKALLSGRALADYQMYWQVDGGQLNLMDNSTLEAPHKEVLVDLTNWNWRGAGPYILNFVAKNANDQTLAQKPVSITIGTNGALSAPTPTQTTTPSPTPTPTPAPTPSTNLPAEDVAFTINSGQSRPISPFIYGTNFQGDPNSWDGSTRNFTMARFGGNRLSTYNWENNASNAGSDWQQQNDGYLGGGDTPGAAVTSRINIAHRSNAAALVTVPMQGYVAEDKNGDGDVWNTPDYLTRRFEQTVAKKNGALSVNPTNGDGAVYQDEFVNLLEQTFPYAKTDAAKKIFYSLDNEPDLWSGTHPRIQREPVTYKSLIDKSIAFANAIKSVAPHGQVFGAANYGYAGFLHLQNAPDANGRNFIDTYLAAMKSAEAQTGKRLLDVLDVHWYPEAQGDGQRIIEDGASSGLAAARMQAPRSLWDPTYKENSWIANDVTKGPIALLPWLKNKINTQYPGTKLAVTEYYYGGGAHISGGIAQADVLGIFGREGVYAGNLWHIGNTDHRFIYGGFAMFRNFDGNGSTFGDKSITATTNNNQDTSVYASVDSANPNRFVIVAINKTGSAKTSNIALTHGTQLRQASVYQLKEDSPTPRSAGTIAVNNNSLRYTMPAYSVTTLVVTQ